MDGQIDRHTDGQEQSLPGSLLPTEPENQEGRPRGNSTSLPACLPSLPPSVSHASVIFVGIRRQLSEDGFPPRPRLRAGILFLARGKSTTASLSSTVEGFRNCRRPPSSLPQLRGRIPRRKIYLKCHLQNIALAPPATLLVFLPSFNLSRRRLVRSSSSFHSSSSLLSIQSYKDGAAGRFGECGRSEESA